jgi:hypothetical protein
MAARYARFVWRFVYANDVKTITQSINQPIIKPTPLFIDVKTNISGAIYKQKRRIIFTNNKEILFFYYVF